jgi:hypothetical protein
MKKIFLFAFLIFIGSSLYSQVPNPPTLVYPPNGTTGISSNNILFRWTKVSGALSYRVQILQGPTIIVDTSGLTDSLYQIQPYVLSSTTLYYWHVNVTTAGGTSNWSTSWNFTTAVVPPPVPTIYPINRGRPIYADSATIFEWSHVSSATSYRFHIINIIDTIVHDTICIVPPYTFTPGTWYYFHLACINSGGQGIWSSIWNFQVINHIASPPTLISPLNNSINVSLTQMLDWSTVMGAGTYRAQVSTSPSFINFVINTSGLVNSGYSIPSGILAYYTQYYWRVKAYNSGDSSSWSEVWNFTTLNQIGISLISTEFPSEYKLYNNYPNPFNPSTNIKYQIKAEVSSQYSEVRIIIYDILGKEIEKLVNEKQSPGTYEINFDGSNLSNGIYFYTLRSGDFTDTKRMMLIK